MSDNPRLRRPRSLGRYLNFAAGASNAMCRTMLAQYDLSLPQWVILTALWQQDGLTVGELAEFAGANLPATSRLVDRMEERRLVHRVIDPRDRRSVLVRLCAAGQERRFLQRFYQDVNATLLEGFSDEEADELYMLLQRVERNARNRTSER